MKQKRGPLQTELETKLRQYKTVDAAEYRQPGMTKRVDERLQELVFRERRCQKIEEPMQLWTPSPNLSKFPRQGASTKEGQQTNLNATSLIQGRYLEAADFAWSQNRGLEDLGYLPKVLC